jgi:hypothetical protein
MKSIFAILALVVSFNVAHADSDIFETRAKAEAIQAVEAALKNPKSKLSAAAASLTSKIELIKKDATAIKLNRMSSAAQLNTRVLVAVPYSGGQLELSLMVQVDTILETNASDGEITGAFNTIDDKSIQTSGLELTEY